MAASSKRLKMGACSTARRPCHSVGAGGTGTHPRARAARWPVRGAAPRWWSPPLTCTCCHRRRRRRRCCLVWNRAWPRPSWTLRSNSLSRRHSPGPAAALVLAAALAAPRTSSNAGPHRAGRWAAR
eukprot:scaffold772_cov361-Prasinococcus_capsulatus_cf.AAC.1